MKNLEMEEMLKSLFLCGCNLEDKKHYSTFSSEDGKVLSHRRFDKQGYEVCPEHGERKFGWRSPMILGPQGNDVIDWDKVSKTFDIQPKK